MCVTLYNRDRQLESIVRPDGATIYLTYELYKEYLDPERIYSGKLMKITVPGRGDISLTYETTGGKKLDTKATSSFTFSETEKDCVALASDEVTEFSLSTLERVGVRFARAENRSWNGLTYDYTGALLATESWSGEVTGTVGRTYNNDFRVTALTVNGIPSAYTYDNDGLLTGAGNLAVTRDPQSGLVTGTTLDTIATAQTYTSFGELAHYEAGTHYSYDITERDKLGRITAKSETVEGVVTAYAYEYDAAGRLATVWENNQLTNEYTYDQNGNRLSRNAVTATYDDQDRMVTYGANSYEYTVNGDLAAKTNAGGTTAYTHDALGNLTAVNLPSGVLIEYSYDGRNRLIAKKRDGVVEYRLIYAGQLAPVAKVDATGTTLETYVYGLGVNAPDYILKDGVKYRLVKDHLGTPRLVVNATTGEVVKRLDLDEFGNITAETGTFDIPFGFAGGIRDADTGLTKFGARWYDPETGRWLEKEPLGFAGSYNFYTYAYNDPVNWVDRTGLEPGEAYSSIEEAAYWANREVYSYASGDDFKNEWASELYEGRDASGNPCFSYTTPHSDGLPDYVSIDTGITGFAGYTHFHPRRPFLGILGTPMVNVGFSTYSSTKNTGDKYIAAITNTTAFLVWDTGATFSYNLDAGEKSFIGVFDEAYFMH